MAGRMWRALTSNVAATQSAHEDARLRDDVQKYAELTRMDRTAMAVAKQLPTFLPDRWLASHPEAKLAMREQESKQKAAKKRARHSHLRAALAAAVEPLSRTPIIPAP